MLNHSPNGDEKRNYFFSHKNPVIVFFIWSPTVNAIILEKDDRLLFIVIFGEASRLTFFLSLLSSSILPSYAFLITTIVRKILAWTISLRLYRVMHSFFTMNRPSVYEKHSQKLQQQLHLPTPELQGEYDIFDLLVDRGPQNIHDSSGILLHQERILSSSTTFSNTHPLPLSGFTAPVLTAESSFFSTGIQLNITSKEPHRSRVRSTTGTTAATTTTTTNPQKYVFPEPLSVAVSNRKAAKGDRECRPTCMGGHSSSFVPTSAYYFQDQTCNQLLPVSTFVDNKEGRRNVRMDLKTQRGYVYTTDMKAHGLPEFLFLDVPNDDFAVSLCGRWITNHLMAGLKEEIRNASVRKRDVVSSCNLKTFEKDVFHPLTPDGSAGEVLTIKFRLRSTKSRSYINCMLAQNFLGRPCPKGIVVLLPSIKPKSPFHSFWGNSFKVPPIPEHDENLTTSRIDNFCKAFASYYGKYYGDFHKPASCKKGPPVTSVEDQPIPVKSPKTQPQSQSRLKRKSTNLRNKRKKKRLARGRELPLTKGDNKNVATNKINTEDC
jgi:hypothetical protein